MTTEKKSAISDLTKGQCAAIIQYAYKQSPKLHKVSQRAFRSIVGEVGHRDRIQKSREGKPIGHWCDSTLEQLADATGFSVAAVRDVLWLATNVGVVQQVKRGGKGTGSKRTIDLDQMQTLLNDLCAEYPHLCDGDWRGIWRNKRGIVPDKRGADTAPLISTQDIYQVTRKANARDNGAIGNALETTPQCEACGNTGFVDAGNGRREVKLCQCRNGDSL
jgi:hypothetical protein